MAVPSWEEAGLLVPVFVSVANAGVTGTGSTKEGVSRIKP